MIMISNFLFNILCFCAVVCFLTKLLTSGILFSTAVNADFEAKPLTSVILFSTAVKADFLTKSLTSGSFFLPY